MRTPVAAFQVDRETLHTLRNRVAEESREIEILFTTVVPKSAYVLRRARIVPRYPRCPRYCTAYLPTVILIITAKKTCSTYNMVRKALLS